MAYSRCVKRSNLDAACSPRGRCHFSRTSLLALSSGCLRPAPLLFAGDAASIAVPLADGTVLQEIGCLLARSHLRTVFAIVASECGRRVRRRGDAEWL